MANSNEHTCYTCNQDRSHEESTCKNLFRFFPLSFSLSNPFENSSFSSLLCPIGDIEYVEEEESEIRTTCGCDPDDIMEYDDDGPILVLFDPDVENERQVLHLRYSSGITVNDADGFCPCILQAAGLSGHPDKEARENLDDAINKRKEAMKNETEAEYSANLLKTALGICQSVIKNCKLKLIEQEAHYEAGMCYLAIEKTLKLGNLKKEREANALESFERAGNYPLALLERAKLIHTQFYSELNNNILLKAIEKYKEAETENEVLGDEPFRKDLQNTTALGILYHLGSAYLELALRSENHKADLLDLSKSEFEKTQNILNVPHYRKDHPQFEDLQGAYNYGTVLKELGLIHIGNDQWKWFNRAIKTVKPALPHSAKWPNLRRDMLLLIGACYHMSHKVQVKYRRQASPKLLESAAHAYRVAYVFDNEGMSGAIACYNLGNVLYEKKDFKDAVVYYNRAKKITMETGNYDSQFKADIEFNLDIAQKEADAEKK